MNSRASTVGKRLAALVACGVVAAICFVVGGGVGLILVSRPVPAACGLGVLSYFSMVVVASGLLPALIGFVFSLRVASRRGRFD